MRRLVPALIFLWSLAWIQSRSFPDLPPGNDSCQYLVSAQGFATGHPFRDFSSPVPDAGAQAGPSFFPMLLSLYWLFIHPHLAVLKWAVALLMSLAPVMAFLWLRLHLPYALALSASLAFGANYAFIVQGDSIMTECVYCPMFYAALWFSQKFSQGLPQRLSQSFPQRPGPESSAVAEGGSPWAMTLWVILARTRVVGWFFFAAYALLAAKRRRWGVLALGAGLASAWVAWEHWLSRGVQVLKYTNGVFTRQFPVLVDPWHGIASLAANFAGNLWSFATVIDAHLLWPFLYETMAMNKPKRIACLAVFCWSLRGAWIVWRGKPVLRPWLAAAALSLVPTFLIFEPHDNFRYLMPLFPFLALFFLAPFQGDAPAWRRSLPVAVGALLVLGQALGSMGHDFDSEYIDYPRDFAALHDSLLAMPDRPDLLLSPDFHYSFLRVGCPALHMQSRHKLEYVRPLALGKETWAICGPRNDYFCLEWEKKGVVFGNPPLRQTRYWRLLRIESWPP